MKSLNAKTDISIFINLRYLRLKLLKNKENNKKICDIFHHIFKNISCYLTSEVSLKRFYFVLFDDGLTLKTLKLAYIWHLKLFIFNITQLNFKIILITYNLGTIKKQRMRKRNRDYIYHNKGITDYFPIFEIAKQNAAVTPSHKVVP